MNMEHYKRILDSIEVPVLVLDNQYRYVYVNNATFKLTGIPCSDYIGKLEHDLFPAVQADIFMEHNRYVMETGEEDNNEEQLTNIHGNLKTIITNKKLFTCDKGSRFIIITIRDITREKQAEKALQDNEKKIPDDCR